MKKETCRAITITLLVALSLIAPSILVSKSDLATEMPVVYVEPQVAHAAVGTTFNVGVRIFNLTNNFYGTDDAWRPGEPLPSPGSRYNYSLGNLYGLTMCFYWDPEILEYASHSIKSPVQDHPDGILYGPIVQVHDDINSTAGTYTITQSSVPLLIGFNSPDRNATIFTMAFKVKKEGNCTLRLDNIELIVDPILMNEGISEIIPHKIIEGKFEPAAVTRLTGIEVGALTGAKLHTPLIIGENATMNVLLTNYGASPNVFNLTVHEDINTLKTWSGENLLPGESRNYSHSIPTDEIGTGLHTVTAKASIVHDRTIVSDSLQTNFTVVDVPVLDIAISPHDLYKNETATLSAATSFHADPGSAILEFKWFVFAPNSIHPQYYDGESVDVTFVESGTWRTILIVKDSLGITYNPSRNATQPYLKKIFLDVSTRSNLPSTNTFPRLDQVVIILISLTGIAIIGIIFYDDIKRRRQYIDE